MVPVVLSGISPPFGRLFRSSRQVIHVLLTRAPLYSSPCGDFLARLACVRHAASVRSEPGSNSPIELGVDLPGWGNPHDRWRPAELASSTSLRDFPCTLGRSSARHSGAASKKLRVPHFICLRTCYSDFKERPSTEAHDSKVASACQELLFLFSASSGNPREFLAIPSAASARAAPSSCLGAGSGQASWRSLRTRGCRGS